MPLDDSARIGRTRLRGTDEPALRRGRIRASSQHEAVEGLVGVVRRSLDLPQAFWPGSTSDGRV